MQQTKERVIYGKAEILCRLGRKTAWRIQHMGGMQSTDGSFIPEQNINRMNRKLPPKRHIVQDGKETGVLGPVVQALLRSRSLAVAEEARAWRPLQ